MKIRELEKALREGMRVYPDKPALALLTGDGPLAGSVPAEFVEAARTLASRSGKRSGKEDGTLASHGWF